MRGDGSRRCRTSRCRSGLCQGFRLSRMKNVRFLSDADIPLRHSLSLTIGHHRYRRGHAPASRPKLLEVQRSITVPQLYRQPPASRALSARRSKASSRPSLAKSHSTALKGFDKLVHSYAGLTNCTAQCAHRKLCVQRNNTPLIRPAKHDMTAPLAHLLEAKEFENANGLLT